jgi:hypothetical protein
MPTGVLSEPLDAGPDSRLPRLRACIVREIRFRELAHDEDLVSIELDGGCRYEPVAGQTPGEPTLKVFVEIALLAHVSMITSLRAIVKGPVSYRSQGRIAVARRSAPRRER